VRDASNFRRRRKKAETVFSPLHPLRVVYVKPRINEHPRREKEIEREREIEKETKKERKRNRVKDKGRDK